MTVTVLPPRTKDETVLNSYIGQRIRIARIALGVSQQGLAGQLGLTFQQIQKYERGRNRISASRLYEISRALGVDVQVFYEGLEEGAGGVLPQRMQDLTEAYERLSPQFGARELVELNQAFMKISSRETQLMIIQLAELIADRESETESVSTAAQAAGRSANREPADEEPAARRPAGKLVLV